MRRQKRTVYFKQFDCYSGTGFAFFYLKGKSGENTTSGEMKENEKCQK